MSPIIAKEIPKKGEKDKGVKKFKPPIFRFSRGKALAFLKSQECASAYKGIAVDEISTGYNPIYTQDIVTRLARYGFVVCGCGQQVTRRDWKRYNNPDESDYKEKIDTKQNAAKHYVILKHEIDSHPFKIMITNSGRIILHSTHQFHFQLTPIHIKIRCTLKNISDIQQ